MQESERPFSLQRFALKVGGGMLCLVVLRVLWLQFGVPGIMFGSIGIMMVLGATLLGAGVLTFRRTVKSYRPSRADGQVEVGPKGKSRLISQFVWASLVYLLLVCPILSILTDCHPLLVFLAVMAGVVFTATVILVWVTSWAMRTDSRRNQFSILTLLFLTLLAAIYLGAIRWIADLSGDRLGAGGQTFLAAAVLCVILTLISLPFLVLVMESLVWFAAWLVRRPWVQRRIRR
jgi:hypothetical protein